MYVYIIHISDKLDYLPPQSKVLLQNQVYSVYTSVASNMDFVLLKMMNLHQV